MSSKGACVRGSEAEGPLPCDLCSGPLPQCLRLLPSVMSRPLASLSPTFPLTAPPAGLTPLLNTAASSYPGSPAALWFLTAHRAGGPRRLEAGGSLLKTACGPENRTELTGRAVPEVERPTRTVSGGEGQSWPELCRQKGPLPPKDQGPPGAFKQSSVAGERPGQVGRT